MRIFPHALLNVIVGLVILWCVEGMSRFITREEIVHKLALVSSVSSRHLVLGWNK